MREYRIVEENRQIWIEQLVKGKSWDSWVEVDKPNIPRYHPTVEDARSWVETLRKGRVFHIAEDAPNIAQDERKPDDGVKPLGWFLEREGKVVICDLDFGTNKEYVRIYDDLDARRHFNFQYEVDYRYSDPS